ncbi:MAG: hypothetical protein INR67_12980, partial [Jatrophihabitans endophyticus]
PRQWQADTQQAFRALLEQWDDDRLAAYNDAVLVGAGAGRFGRRRAKLEQASQQLQAWGERWRPLIPEIPTDPDALHTYALAIQDRTAVRAVLGEHAQHQADCLHPDHADLAVAVEAARTRLHTARAQLHAAERDLTRSHSVAGLRQLTPAADHDLDNARSVLDEARRHVQRLLDDPALLAAPDCVASARLDWELQTQQLRRATAPAPAQLRPAPSRADRFTSRAPADGFDIGL